MSGFVEFYFLRLKVKAAYLIEGAKVFWNYYRNPFFLASDLLLKFFYLFSSPYQTSKKFLSEKGVQDVHTFGETPLTTLDKIMQAVAVKENDVVFELGCATGRTSFWLRHFTQATVVGIEYVPDFVYRASIVKKWLKIKRLDFCLQDMRQVYFKMATVVYIYGSCFEDDFLEVLTARLRELEKGACVITVSYPLTDYQGSESLFEVTDQFPAKFFWGEGEVYIQRRT